MVGAWSKEEELRYLYALKERERHRRRKWFWLTAATVFGVALLELWLL